MTVHVEGFEWRPLGPTGGPYDHRADPKIVWHTWEGYSWSSAESAFAKYPPHVAVNPRDRIRRQYVSLDRHAMALAGTDTENSWCIQIEVAGYAGETHDWPAADLEWLGRDVLAPIQAAIAPVTRVPDVIAPQGFHGEGEGIILASPSSPVRFGNVAAWDAFAGHVGHQHAPAPDSHWDPGRLNVAAIITAAAGGLEQREDDDMPPKATYTRVAGAPEVYLAGVGFPVPRHVTAFKDAEYHLAREGIELVPPPDDAAELVTDAAGSPRYVMVVGDGELFGLPPDR